MGGIAHCSDGVLPVDCPMPKNGYGHGHNDCEDRSVQRLLFEILNVLSDTERRNEKRHDELLAAILRQGKKRVSFGFKVGVPKLKERQNMPLEIKITNEQMVSVTVTPRTDSGKPAKLDGSPAWTVISGNSQVVVSEDGLSANLISSDEPGDTTINVQADADLGEGVETIADVILLTVVGATAKNLGLTAGTPVPKPEPPPPV